MTQTTGETIYHAVHDRKINEETHSNECKRSDEIIDDTKENLPFNSNSEIPSTTKLDKLGNNEYQKLGTRSVQPTITSMFNRKRKVSENDKNSVSLSENKTDEIPADNEISTLHTLKKVKSNGTWRCKSCFQLENQADLLFYDGHPPGAVSELEAMFHKHVTLIEGSEVERGQFKITEFSVFCTSSHLCPFDTGLIEKNAKLYFSGYMKCIIDESTGIDSGVPMYSAGPIVEWSISGYDGGQKSILGFSTEFADYYIMKPNEKYAAIMQPAYEKAAMCKVVVEYLLDNCDLDPSYEDMLCHLKTCVPPHGYESYTEDLVLRHAQFICDQVASIDACEPNEVPLITLRCIRTLISLVGIKFTKAATRKSEKSAVERKKIYTKATTTPLVREIFESFFPEQLDMDNKLLTLRRKRCGVCDPCQQPDCGKCTACLAMVKFGGTGKTKKACHNRVCPNMTVQEAEESDPEDEEVYTEKSESKIDVFNKTPLIPTFNKKLSIESAMWIGDGNTENSRTYYKSCQIQDIVYVVGDFVMLLSDDPTVPQAVAQIIYFYEKSELKMFHAQFYVRGSNTILGEVSHPKEVFITNTCQSLELYVIDKKAFVEYKSPSEDWAQMGGFKEEILDYDETTFYYQKRYDEFAKGYSFSYDRKYARFEDPEPLINKLNEHSNLNSCVSCDYNKKLEEYEVPHFNSSGDAVMWRGHIFSAGDAVLINSDKFDLACYSEDQDKIIKMENVDDKEYPEYYRKADNAVRGSNARTAQPFGLGYIAEVYTKCKGISNNPSDIWIKVYRMYRPENIPDISHHIHDLNLVFWSFDMIDINFSDCVAGKCYLMYTGASELNVDEWAAKGPLRFYFRDVWDPKDKVIKPVTGGIPASVGSSGKGKLGKKGVGKVKSSIKDKASTPMPEYNEPSKALRTLDVFAGCGGLSKGLHQAGISVPEWAIEFDKSAAAAYKLNNPNSVVLNEDCNHILRYAMDGTTHTNSNLRIPLRGEVELLCGGPPCQGFSGMNRFNKLEYSLFKNSLVATYLSYCDFYRPKFFVLENVRNFVAFKGGMVLKLTLRCLVAMGYQCTFGILQAGNYGVPQTRRRLIILAAAPGERLPSYPEPSHVFNRRACTLSVTVDGKKYSNNIIWEDQAPYRTISIRDAMSDLPPISSGNTRIEQDYDCIPQSHFQRKMRSDGAEILSEHITKDQSPLVQARISLIPTHIGADWRDLPNRSVRLSDGKLCDILRYSYDDKKNGRSPSGLKRGVCACASKKPCNSYDRQFNTLIPWCLPHTANRHNNWAGLYGRLDWNGYFGTTITNPEPMGKQGRVLHPDQHRVVSVRECARSQGFPDSYKFYGPIVDKHRQVGNAVPPPMAYAIGMEIRKCLS